MRMQNFIRGFIISYTFGILKFCWTGGAGQFFAFTKLIITVNNVNKNISFFRFVMSFSLTKKIFLVKLLYVFEKYELVFNLIILIFSHIL